MAFVIFGLFFCVVFLVVLMGAITNTIAFGTIFGLIVKGIERQQEAARPKPCPFCGGLLPAGDAPCQQCGGPRNP